MAKIKRRKDELVGHSRGRIQEGVEKNENIAFFMGEAKFGIKSKTCGGILDFNLDLLKLVFPEVLLVHFDLTNTHSEKELLHFYFEEKNVHPKEFVDVELVSKGFYDEITVQDFPLRGKQVYLHIRRRRWQEKTTKQVVKRNWELVGQGTRMVNEFANFLKEISQY